MQSDTLRHTIERRQGQVVAIAIALDGRLAASVSWDRRVWLWVNLRLTGARYGTSR